jgi:hypothetical protein
VLDISADLLAVYRHSYTMSARATAWLGDQQLGDIPIAEGSVTFDATLAVPESVSLTVPRIDQTGYAWDPLDNDHPLSTYGQQIAVSVGVGVAEDVEWLDLGWFLLTDTTTDGDAVRVTAAGLLELVNEARFAAPFQPNGSLTDTIQSLVEPALTVLFDPTLTDRTAPITMSWDEDRLGALNEVCDAWPADLVVLPDGTLYVYTPVDYTAGTPVWDFTDDPAAGTIITFQGSTARDGAYNLVVARGEDAGGQQIQGVAYDLDAASSTRYGGNFSPLPVPFMYYSPLLVNVTQCRAAAQTILARKKRETARHLSVETVPMHALRPGDLVTVSSDAKRLDGARAVIQSLTFPLHPGGGSMRADVALVG